MQTVISPNVAAVRMDVNPKSFYRAILPLMLQIGHAEQIGGRRFVIRGATFPLWEKYAQERRRRIDSGEWAYSRPWSLEDFEEVVGPIRQPEATAD